MIVWCALSSRAETRDPESGGGNRLWILRLGGRRDDTTWAKWRKKEPSAFNIVSLRLGQFKEMDPGCRSGMTGVSWGSRLRILLGGRLDDITSDEETIICSLFLSRGVRQVHPSSTCRKCPCNRPARKKIEI